MMYKIRKSVTVIATLMISVFLQSAQNSKKAKNFTDQVSLKVRSYDNIVLDFKYTVNNRYEFSPRKQR